MNDNLEIFKEEPETFPWEDINRCRNIKKSPENDDTEAEIRKRLEGR